MYRQYENPYKVEKMLEKQKAYCRKHPDDVDAAIELAELEERLNFAWQDDEVEMDGNEY